MKRIDGDHEAAVSLEAVRRLLLEAEAVLTEDMPADLRASRGVASVVRAQLVLARALTQLEALTDVPLGAIAIDPSFGRAA